MTLDRVDAITVECLARIDDQLTCSMSHDMLQSNRSVDLQVTIYRAVKHSASWGCCV